MSDAVIPRRTSTRPNTFMRSIIRSSNRSHTGKIGVGVNSTNSYSISPDGPSLPYSEWEGTRDTVHMWTQIVGKTRLMLTPLVNHWWNVVLYVTPVGLTTSPIPYRDIAFDERRE